jgi:hypothetical protein
VTQLTAPGTAGRTATSPPRSVRRCASAWAVLASPAAPVDTFDPAMVGDFPEPARRWLVHAIAPGTPLWRSVELSMRGRIRLGSWRRFTARQVVNPPAGYLWAATARVFGLPVTGYDRMSGGTAEMRWRLLRWFPVMSTAGPKVARSAAGRLASETVMLPTAFRGATWGDGRRPDTAVASWHIGGERQDLEMHVGPDGQLLDLVVQRWGQPPGAPYGHYPFGVTVHSERTFGGVTIPDRLSAGWWCGTPQRRDEFFRARITDATFR